MRTIRSAAAALCGLVLLAACDSPSDGGQRVPARLDIVAGDLQTQAAAGTELPEALVVRVVDDRGRPVSDQLVNFVVTAGGGSVFAGSAITDRDGEARERWTLGTVAGDTQRVEARAVNTQTGQPIVFATFRAVARAAAPATLEIVGAQQRDAPAGGQADSLVVRVKDQYGNAVPGATVTWLVAAGGGSISPAQSTTGANGTAKAAWTLGAVVDAPAQYSQQARAHLGAVQPGTACVPPTCAQFAGRAGLPAGAVIAKVSGDDQEGSLRVELPQPLVVRVTVGGVPVQGARVSFSSMVGPTNPIEAFTDANGLASTRWTPGPGWPVTMTASLPNGAQTVFTARVEDPQAIPVTLFSPLPIGGSTLPTQVVARARCSECDGLTLTLGSTTLQGQPLDGRLEINGVVDLSAHAGETITITLRATRLNGQSVTQRFTATVDPQFAPVLTRVSGDNQTWPRGTLLNHPVRVRLTRPDGTPIVGRLVTMATDRAAFGYPAPVSSNVYTNAAGEAEIEWILGNALGTQTATVMAAGRAVTFSVNAVQ